MNLVAVMDWWSRFVLAWELKYEDIYLQHNN
jgi:hypothetical protein